MFGEYNPESLKPLDIEIANRSLCREIAKACLDRGLRLHPEVQHGVTSEYGSYRTMAELEGLRDMIVKCPLLP